jgi:septum site-determining protein MinC
MTKIAIISQPEQGVLIDVGGCSSLQEATQHLTYTLQVSSQFWEDQPVDLSLGNLSLGREELAQIFATLNEVGVKFRSIFAQAAATKAALRSFNVIAAAGAPASLPVQAAGTEQPGTGCSGNSAPDEMSSCATDMFQNVSIAGTAAQIDCTQSAVAATTGAAAVVEQRAAAPVERETIPVEVDGTITGALPEAPVQLEIPGTASRLLSAGESTADVENGTEITGEAPTPGDSAAKKEAEPAKPSAPHVMFLRQTLRSGQAISHKGHLVIIGDVNAGAEVIAEGDITVWGALRGVAHAGVGGNLQAEIRALRFDPIQLRIANAIARSPDRPRAGQKYNGPETARIVNGTIRIASSAPE